MLRKELNRFLDKMIREKRYSPRSIEAYKSDLSDWVSFLEKKYQDFPSSARNDPLFLRIYLHERSENKVSNRSLARFLSSLSSFQKALASRSSCRRRRCR